MKNTKIHPCLVDFVNLQATVFCLPVDFYETQFKLFIPRAVLKVNKQLRVENNGKR